MPMGAQAAARKAARFKTWYLQGKVETQTPNPSFPPTPPPFFTVVGFGDKEEIPAYHTPDLKNVGNEQFQDGIGNFTVRAGANVGLNSILRSDELNVYVKIMSEGTPIYGFNQNQVVRYRYQIISRNEAAKSADNQA